MSSMPIQPDSDSSGLANGQCANGDVPRRNVCSARSLVWSTVAVVAGLAWFLVMPSARGEVFSGSTRIDGSAQGGQGNWFAIMGHVGAPKTYELPTRAPSLVKFITLAGGLDPRKASGQVRVIRSGRVHHFYYQERSTETLMPGDLVIADGRIGQGSVFRGSQAVEDNGQQRKWIGLIGLREWPVIMYEVSERATVRAITHMLGQSDQAAFAVRPLLPTQSATATIDSLLPDGSVLIFDPSTIDAARLPRDLPVPEKPFTQPPQMASAAPSGQPVYVNPQPEAGDDADATGSIARSPAGPATPPPGQSADSSVLPPGYRRVPNVVVTPPGFTAAPNRDDEEAARDILADPHALELDPVVQPRIGRAHIADSSTGNESAPSPSPGRGRSAPGSEGVAGRVRISTLPQPAAAVPTDDPAASDAPAGRPLVSPIAETPFTSMPETLDPSEPGLLDADQPDRATTGVTAPLDRSASISPLPMVRTGNGDSTAPSDSAPRPSPGTVSPGSQTPGSQAPGSQAPGSNSSDAGEANASRSNVAESTTAGSTTAGSTTAGSSTGGSRTSEVSHPSAGSSASSATGQSNSRIPISRVTVGPPATGPSLALEAAGTTSRLPAADGPAGRVSATPSSATQSSAMSNPISVATPASDVFPTPVIAASTHPQDASIPAGPGTRDIAAHTTLNDGSPAAGSRASRIIPAPQTEWSWAQISMAVAAGVGSLYAAAMLLTLLKHQPPVIAAPVHGERYWLDRVIENDLPIDVEPAVFPANQRMFGNATTATVLRLDAAHSSVPKPHFPLVAGQSDSEHRTAAAVGAGGNRPRPRDDFELPRSRNENNAADQDRSHGHSEPINSDLREDSIARQTPSPAMTTPPTRPEPTELAVSDATATAAKSTTAAPGASEPASSNPSSEDAKPRHSRRTFRIDHGHRMPGVRSETLPLPGTESDTVEPPASRGSRSAADESGSHESASHESASLSAAVAQPAAAHSEAAPLTAGPPSPTRAAGPNVAHQRRPGDVSVQPAAAIRHGSDLLDRILASVTPTSSRSSISALTNATRDEDATTTTRREGSAADNDSPQERGRQ